jgi:hypothetical protein
MPQARQDNSAQAAIASIFRKIDAMVDSIVETNDTNFAILSSMKNILKSETTIELKNQTKILTEIKKAITIKGKNYAAVAEPKMAKSDSESFKQFGSAYLMIVKASNSIKPGIAATVRALFKAIGDGLKNIGGNAAKKSTESIKAIGELLSIGGNILLFAKSIVMFKVLSPLINLGTKVFIKTVDYIINSLGNIKGKNLKNVKTLVDMGKDIFLFGLALAGFALVSIPAALGAGAFVLIVKMLDVFLSKDNKKSLKGLSVIVKIGAGILLFGLGLAAITLIAPQMTIGALLTVMIIVGLAFAFSLISTKPVDSGIKNLAWIGISIIVLAGAFWVFNTIVDPGMALFSLLVIGGTALVFAIAGKFASEIEKGAFMMMLSSVPIILMALAMFVFKKMDITLVDTALVLGLMSGVGLVMTLAGVASELIIPGAIALGLSAVAILIMSYTLEKFQSLNWTQKNSNDLQYTIKSVLFALSGTSANKGIMGNVAGAVGQGLQAIMSLISIGPLILGSAAIWLMSTALEKFKTVNWTPADSVTLSGVITSVIDSISGKTSITGQPTVGQSMLGTIISLFSAGSIIIGSAAIWLMSEALIKFKSVGWNPTLNATLGNAIAMTTNTLAGGSVNIKVNPAMGILQTILALVGAGGLFVSGAAIWLFSEALLKFKSVKWDGSKDNAALLGAINGVQSAINDSVGTVKADSFAPMIASIGDSLVVFATGLKKFKDANWFFRDTQILQGALNMMMQYDDTKKFNQLNTVANNFERIANSMGQIKNNINDIDVKNLTLTDSMMKSLVVLSKNPEAISGAIKESIESAFSKMTEEMQRILMEVLRKNVGNSVGNTSEPSTVKPTITPLNTTIQSDKTLTPIKGKIEPIVNNTINDKLPQDIAKALIEALRTSGMQIAIGDNRIVYAKGI